MQAKKHIKSSKERLVDKIYYLYRVIVILAVVSIFIPNFNPARVTSLVNETLSLFTAGISYESLTANTIRAINRGWVTEDIFKLLFTGSMITCIGIVGLAVNGCMSLGSLKLKKLGNVIAMASSVIGIIGLAIIGYTYTVFSQSNNPDKVVTDFPIGFIVTGGIIAIVLILTIIMQVLLPKVSKDDIYSMESKYKLFLILMPFIALTFIFSYLTLWGWRYAFFDYKAGGTLNKDNFVGFKWFTYLFQNEATRNDVFRVLKNTLIMSALGLSTSWLAMAFAIFMCEIKSLKVRRLIQTCTTIPNFISWVLVYAVATIIFSTDGLISNLIVNGGGKAVNFLMNGDYIWIKMLAWGLWKGIGWSAIIYIAGISGIDQQLYEAATVDGAGRFKRMWHITVPGLLPTFFVLFIMGIAGILSNGLDQYLVFENPNNTKNIEVLDLYVYNLGINGGRIAISTVIGMVKSLVSVILLFSANKVSKVVRGESII